MKKVLSHIIAFVLGICVSIAFAVYAATSITSAQVTYTGNSQSTVEGALNNLYTKANTWIDPSIYPLKMNSAGKIWANPAGLCFKRNNKSYCLGTNNWTYEKDHIQQVFSGMTCNVNSYSVDCVGSDFSCFVTSSGRVRCYDWTDNSDCYVYEDGSVECT